MVYTGASIIHRELPSTHGFDRCKTGVTTRMNQLCNDNVKILCDSKMHIYRFPEARRSDTNCGSR